MDKGKLDIESAKRIYDYLQNKYKYSGVSQ